MKHSKEGVMSFCIRYIRPDGGAHANMKERDNGTLSGFVSTCRGLKSTHAT